MRASIHIAFHSDHTKRNGVHTKRRKYVEWMTNFQIYVTALYAIVT